MDRFEEIPIEQIEWQDPVRDEISQKDIDDMARSLLANDQIEPIIIEKVCAKKYRGIVGRLRFEGARRAGKFNILARVHNFADDSDRKAWQLIENLVRRDLNPVAIGEGYKKFKECCEKELGGKGYSKAIMAEMKKKIHGSSGEKGHSEKTIWKYIQFAEEIPENVKQILKSLPRESFGKRHAEQLLRLKDELEFMVEVAEKITDKNLTSRQLKMLIDDHFKVEEKAYDGVKEALAKEEISLRTAAAVAEADEDVQPAILRMSRHLRPPEVKKVVNFTLSHKNRVDEILDRPADEAVAIAEGKSVLKTPEDIEAFFRKRSGKLVKTENYEIPCKCPNCKASFKRKLTVDWEHGEVQFQERGVGLKTLS